MVGECMDKWNKYKYLGYQEETISKVRRQMDIDNVKSVKNVSLLLFALLAILVVFYGMFDNHTTRTIICLISVLLLFLIYGAAAHMLKHKQLCTPLASDVLIDSLSFLCFAVAIYLGTFAASKDMAVAPIWMFFFAILIFNRLPLRNLYVLLIAGVVFSLCSGFLKGSHHFQYDVMHATTSIIASVYVSWYKSKMKVENILSLRMLEKDNEHIKEEVVERKKETMYFRRKADYDELTGLYNKASFHKIVDTTLNKGKGNYHVFVCLDLDNFKAINDTFGHLYGDIVLKDMVEEIKKNMRFKTTIGRFGGDEFMLFIENVEDIDAVLQNMQEMEKLCCKRYTQNGIDRDVSISSGYALFPNDGVRYMDLFEKADGALYKAKRAKKARR